MLLRVPDQLLPKGRVGGLSAGVRLVVWVRLHDGHTGSSGHDGVEAAGGPLFGMKEIAQMVSSILEIYKFLLYFRPKIG